MKGSISSDEKSSNEKAFDPQASERMKHTRMGVWDFYTEKRQISLFQVGWRLPGTSKLERYFEISRNLPYIWKMLKDISKIENVQMLLSLYILSAILKSILPAISLWFSGQLLIILQEAIDTRTVDIRFLLWISIGRLTCAIGENVPDVLFRRFSRPIKSRLQRFYAEHVLAARARLDLPTYQDTVNQRQLDQVDPTYHPGSIAWTALDMIIMAMTTGVQMATQMIVLFRALQDQPDGHLFAAISLSHSIFTQILKADEGLLPINTGTWVATTRNADYVRMQGLKKTVAGVDHRKELVAGNLGEYCVEEYTELARGLGDDAADLWELLNEYQYPQSFNLMTILKNCWGEFPQILFVLRAIQNPTSIPLSLASLQLIKQTTASFEGQMLHFLRTFGSIAEHFVKVRKLYMVATIPNTVLDGNEPFPEDVQKIRNGMSVEFNRVSFKYPGADRYALRDVSFKISQGQLCVIVGANGSGKSTILKLVLRLYDIEDGQILVNGKDIRTMRLADLRRTISVLFQDYSLFPLSIRDNIALGDSTDTATDDCIRQAAKLGGADEFIERLAEGYDSYIERPVKDVFENLPDGTTTLFGRQVDAWETRDVALSGGQLQRLAVARTFLRSVVSPESMVGLLLFDEPSASLDPIAEHDLFARLRELRGDKTMLFSSHRFGSLTKHADVILYMSDSLVIESGTHEQLLKREGDYARLWKLQVDAFL